MPNRRALQIHFLAIAEWIAALRATGAGRVEVMVIAGLEHFAADVTLAISAFDAEGLLVILFAVGLAVLTHILAAQDCAAHQTSTKDHDGFIVIYDKHTSRKSTHLKHQICH